MKRALLLLLLAGCDRSSDNQPNSRSLPAGAAAPGAAQPAAGATPADQLEQRARTALGAIVPDPKSMRFAALRAGTSNAVCGEVEAKQPDGKPAVRPFVVTPEGVAVVSTTAEVRIDDPEDPFPDFHMRWCASPAELARLQSQMIGGETLGLGAAPPPPSEIPDVPPDIPADLPMAAPSLPERPAAQVKAGPPPKPPAPTSDDSFFNAVARPVRDGN